MYRKIVGIKQVRLVLYSLMSTLDLTADAHKVRQPTSYTLRSRTDSFVARYDYLYTALAVVATETSLDTWTVSTYPGVEVLNSENEVVIPSEVTGERVLIFYGNRTYTVDNGLAVAFLAAGYEVLGEAFSSGFSTGFEV